MNITIKYLKYFAVAAKTGNFAKASEELHVSNSSVVSAINKLEEEFGFLLFIRQPSRGLVLTPDGREALKHAKYVLEEVEEFGNRISGIPATLNGTLNVACFTTFSTYFMPYILSKLHDLYPDLKINVYEEGVQGVEKLLMSGEIDAFLTYRSPGLPLQITYETLRTVRPHAIISCDHPLAKKDVLELEDLADYPMILFNLPSSRAYAMGLFAVKNLYPDVILKSQSVEGVREYVGEGLGFSIMHLEPPSKVTLNGKKIACKPIAGKEIQGIDIIAGAHKSPNGKQAKKVEAFISECQHLFSSEQVERFFVKT